MGPLFTLLTRFCALPRNDRPAHAVLQIHGMAITMASRNYL